MKQWEQPSSDARQVDFGEMSSLTDVEEVAPAVIDLLGTLFNDHEPQGEDGRRVVFVFGASVLRARTGIAEMDETLRETYLAFDDRPRAEWHVEADLDAITALARTLVHSRERPDTQIAGPAHLELLVRDETEHTALLAPQGSATVHEVPTAKGTCTVTVGPPSAALLLRLGLRRTGMEHLTGVFDRERTSAHLIEQERRRGWPRAPSPGSRPGGCSWRRPSPGCSRCDSTAHPASVTPNWSWWRRRSGSGWPTRATSRSCRFSTSVVSTGRPSPAWSANSP